MHERRVITRVVRTLPDDTEAYVPEDLTQRAALIGAPTYPSLLQDKAIDSFVAMQLGLWQILSSLRMWSIDLQALLAGRKESREFQFERIFFDFATMEDDRVPNNSVTIMQQGPTQYSYTGRPTYLLEDTANYFCPGSILQVLHTAEVTLSAVCHLGDKDDRGGVRRAIEDAFAEPLDERAGRRVVVPQYYEQTARFSLQEIDYPDTFESATDNTWPLVARFLSDINVVRLVPLPGAISAVKPQVFVEPLDGTGASQSTVFVVQGTVGAGASTLDTVANANTAVAEAAVGAGASTLDTAGNANTTAVTSVLLDLDFTTTSQPSAITTYTRAGTAAPITGVTGGAQVTKFGAGVYAYAYGAGFAHGSKTGALLEPAATNLHANSEAAASWNSNSGMTVTSNNATAPDGTTTADQCVGTGTSRLQETATGSASTTYTVSVFMKLHAGASSRTVSMQLRDTIGVVSFITPTITSQWVRYVVSGTTSVGATTVALRLDFGSDTNSVDVWGAQIELGSLATSYIPTAGASATRPLCDMRVGTLVTNGYIDHALGAVDMTFIAAENSVGPFYLDIKGTGNNDRLIMRPGQNSARYDSAGTLRSTLLTDSDTPGTEHLVQLDWDADGGDIPGDPTIMGRVSRDGVSVDTQLTGAYTAGTTDSTLYIARRDTAADYKNMVVSKLRIWAAPQPL